ncbi:kelch repeat and BTB domain-containing protein 4-like isoform X2 [Montipora capricornis]|uniref:kelch repeat and BTB domain-containing protein 4-like isoform X2 n=1 Tax=Montipora capricornis TaxID=246305 RepID=UPI0035F1EA26
MACTSSCHHDFSKPWHFSDVVLSVEGVKFHVHKSTLSMWSPVFEKMLTSDFLERYAEQIDLPDDNYQFLLELAEEYQIKRVTEFCTEYLSRNIDSETFARYYVVAEKFGLETVMKESLKESSYLQLSYLESDDDFTELPDKTKVEFLRFRIQELEKTLGEYVTTCSSLVTNVYRTVAATFDRIECDNYQVHGIGRYEHFKLSCKCCRRRVQNANCQVHYSVIKAELKKLFDLGNCNKTAQELKPLKAFR